MDQDQLLSPTAHAAISDPANDLLLSAASIREIAIKVGLNKLSLTLPFRQWIDQAMADLGVTVLPITAEYADLQSRLPSDRGVASCCLPPLGRGGKGGGRVEW